MVYMHQLKIKLCKQEISKAVKMSNLRSFMIQALCSVMFLIGMFPSCRLDTQRCPSGFMCSIEEIGRKSLSCETSAQKSGSDFFSFPSTLPNNTRVFSLTVANEGYAFQESDISFADVSWRQVDEITLRSVRYFQLTKTRLAGVPRLRVLRLQAETLNNILHRDAFLLVPDIEVLDLSYNRRLSLQTVVAALNKSLPILKYLDLCSLQNAFNDPFILNKDFAMAIESKPLITLNVSNTSISYLEHGLTSESIRYLNISYTSLIWIARHPNEHLIPNLEEIDFSHTDVPYWKMSIMMRMTSINHTMSCPRYASSTKRYIGNNMVSVDPIYVYDYRLRFKCNTLGMEEIHLRYSNIRWLNITINIILFSLKYIDLEGNSLEFLSPRFIQRAPNLREIYLARNRLSSMINLGTLFQGSAELEVIDLSQNGLTSIPWPMFMSTPKLKMLRLQGNSLSVLHFSVEKLLNLKLLDLRDSMIKYISRDMINGIVSIGNEQAWCKNNTVDANTSERNESKYLSGMNSSVLLGELMNDQLAIDLTGNIMECTCDNVWFTQWILDTNIPLLCKHMYTCKLNNTLNYMTYELLNDLKYHCKLMNFLGLIIATPCTIFITIVFAYIIVNRRRNISRRVLRANALMERYNVNENEDRQRYFVFLSFAGKDDELVNNYIYPELDKFVREKFGNNDNLICTGDTHFTPGRWIAEEIDRCLNRCDIFVMVVTKHFIESEWCKYEVMLAKQKNKFKILLVNEEVYRQKIPSVLQEILKFCTRATWRLQNGQFVIRPKWYNIFEGMVEASVENMDEVE